jgi:hypothetical protein
MKRIMKKEKIRRVGMALGLLLDELDAVKTTISTKEFDLLVESILHAIRRVPAITKDNRPVVERVHIATELREAHESSAQGPDKPQDQT